MGLSTEPAAFAALYDLHAPAVLRTAATIVGEPAVAEDVTAEVFLDLWRRPWQYDPARGELGAFLHVKARSRALDARRRAASSARVRERCEHEWRPEPGPDPDDAVLAPGIRAAVLRLPETQREAIALAYWGGLSCSEIAEHCGIPLGTAKSRLRLALARLARDVGMRALRPAVS
jgi:RNA polymerase sigma-70 factor, ECF subfamily